MNDVSISRRRSSVHRPAIHSTRIRLDDESKKWLSEAAKRRGISLSEYVRLVAVPQARQEILTAREQSLMLTPDEQLAFWKALAAAPKLTEAQRRLGSLMRGEE
jgi:uncharacterized protein (DUF1778 family)